MSKRTVIVSGGILEKEFVLPILQSEETEFIIGVDKGLQFLYENEIKPDYIVGDFDSVPREIVEYYRTEENVPIREFNPVKMLLIQKSHSGYAWDLEERKFISLEEQETGSIISGEYPVPEYCTGSRFRGNDPGQS